MLLPAMFGENLFDDFMDFPMLRDFGDIDRKLYGKRAAHVMKTDVHENEDGYELAIDLPGFKKEELTLSLHDGYLTVGAAKDLNKEHTDDRGRLIRQERYAGSIQRSFYIGDQITEEEIRAGFVDGVLTLHIPKKQPVEEIPQKKYIAIE